MSDATRIWVWFADNGNIRKWQVTPFEEGTEYIRADKTRVADLVAVLTGLVDKNLAYDGNNIVIPCANHGSALTIVYRARTILDSMTTPAHQPEGSEG